MTPSIIIMLIFLFVLIFMQAKLISDLAINLLFGFDITEIIQRRKKEKAIREMNETSERIRRELDEIRTEIKLIHRKKAEG